jgi:hypothetical protein
MKRENCRKISFVLIGLILLISSCKNHSDYLSQRKPDPAVQDGVHQMLDSIARNVSDKGPVAWLNYFENTPDFFMATDGQLDFPSRDTAAIIINNKIVKQIIAIELKWNNIHIDALSGTLAAIGADFHEDVTDTNGNNLPVNGYFTGIAHRSAEGWQLRNLHWSIKKEKP